MPHVGTGKSWDDLVDFFFASLDYVATLKRVMVAQWIYASRGGDGSPPGTSELATAACNFANLQLSERMAAFGASGYAYQGRQYCSFQNVEHFIDGFFHFIASGTYPRWHLLADRPIDFVAHLQDEGFAGDNHEYLGSIRAIYDQLEDRYQVAAPEIYAKAHSVVHGDYLYKIAGNAGIEIEKVFKLDQNGRVMYGPAIGTLFTGDLLYVIQPDAAHPEGTADNQPVTDPLGDLKPCDRPSGDCAGRTHFVLHQTVHGSMTRTYVLSNYGGSRNKGHVYVLKSGETVFLWPFTEKLVRATKAEHPDMPKYKPAKGSFPTFPITGKLIHVEIDYEENGEPNETQYETVARLYIDACKTVGRILTIVPHIEVDRGIKEGHNDPQNFNYDHFYAVLGSLGVDVGRIPRFAHARYWGKTAYKTPWDTDTFHFPPVLAGNPHA